MKRLSILQTVHEFLINMDCLGIIYNIKEIKKKFGKNKFSSAGFFL